MARPETDEPAMVAHFLPLKTRVDPIEGLGKEIVFCHPLSLLCISLIRRLRKAALQTHNDSLRSRQPHYSGGCHSRQRSNQRFHRRNLVDQIRKSPDWTGTSHLLEQMTIRASS